MKDGASRHPFGPCSHPVCSAGGPSSTLSIYTGGFAEWVTYPQGVVATGSIESKSFDPHTSHVGSAILYVMAWHARARAYVMQAHTQNSRPQYRLCDLLQERLYARAQKEGQYSTIMCIILQVLSSSVLPIWSLCGVEEHLK